MTSQLDLLIANYKLKIKESKSKYAGAVEEEIKFMHSDASRPGHSAHQPNDHHSKIIDAINALVKKAHGHLDAIKSAEEQNFDRLFAAAKLSTFVHTADFQKHLRHLCHLRGSEMWQFAAEKDYEIFQLVRDSVSGVQQCYFDASSEFIEFDIPARITNLMQTQPRDDDTARSIWETMDKQPHHLVEADKDKLYDVTIAELCSLYSTEYGNIDGVYSAAIADYRSIGYGESDAEAIVQSVQLLDDDYRNGFDAKDTKPSHCHANAMQIANGKMMAKEFNKQHFLLALKETYVAIMEPLRKIQTRMNQLMHFAQYVACPIMYDS